jgi:hypothetical protein
MEPEAAPLTVEEEKKEVPPPFAEVRAPPEYSICVNTQYQEWVWENIILRERANAAL